MCFAHLDGCPLLLNVLVKEALEEGDGMAMLEEFCFAFFLWWILTDFHQMYVLPKKTFMLRIFHREIFTFQGYLLHTYISVEHLFIISLEKIIITLPLESSSFDLLLLNPRVSQIRDRNQSRGNDQQGGDFG